MAYDLDPLKSRLLISDETYDYELTDALNEAVRYVVVQILAYDTSFIGDYVEEGTMLFDATLDIAAGIFKRRHMPQDMDQGWWNLGLKKLAVYIKSAYNTEGKVYFSGLESEEEG